MIKRFVLGLMITTKQKSLKDKPKIIRNQNILLYSKSLKTLREGERKKGTIIKLENKFKMAYPSIITLNVNEQKKKKKKKEPTLFCSLHLIMIHID